jgi:hypothetical protein
MDGTGFNPTKRDKIPAQVWNRVIRATTAVEGEAHSLAASFTKAQRTPCHLLARNSSGITLDKHSIVQFKPGGSEMWSGNPDDIDEANLLAHLASPSMQTHAPDRSAAFWGVTVDPMSAGAIGRVVVVGMVMCRVNVTSQSHYAAIPQDGDYSVLASAAGGGNSAQIVWRHGDFGEQWCLVRLGSAPAAGGVRIAVTSSTWEKGSSRTMSVLASGTADDMQYGQDPPQVTAWNLFANIPANRKVAIAYNADYDAYYVVAAEC